MERPDRINVYAGSTRNAVILEAVSDSEGYDWSDEYLVMRLADGELFYSYQSGCSCNGPWEGETWAGCDRVTSPATVKSDWAHEIRVAAGRMASVSRPVRQRAAELMAERDLSLEQAIILARSEAAAKEVR